MPRLAAMTLSSPAGTIDLFSTTTRYLIGPRGFGGPSAPRVTRSAAGVDGARPVLPDGVQGAQVLDPLDLIIPVRFSDATANGVWALIEQTRYVLNSRLHGPSLLTVTLGDGTKRYLDVVLAEEAGDFDPPRRSEYLAQSLMLRFEVDDPRPRGDWTSPITWLFQTTGSGGSLPLSLPLSLAPGSLLGGINGVIVAGREAADVLVWIEGPTAGPFTVILDEGTTNRQSYTVQAPALLKGQVASIDQRQNAAVPVRGPNGESWTRYLDDYDRDLWSPKPGDHSVTVSIPGISVGSKAAMSFRPRFRSLLS